MIYGTMLMYYSSLQHAADDPSGMKKSAQGEYKRNDPTIYYQRKTRSISINNK
jgi:hypothetical protein